jgi:hypothetical protein
MNKKIEFIFNNKEKPEIVFSGSFSYSDFANILLYFSNGNPSDVICDKLESTLSPLAIEKILSKYMGSLSKLTKNTNHQNIISELIEAQRPAISPNKE